MWWADHVARIEESRALYRVLVGKTDGKSHLEKPTHRWKDNIKMDDEEEGCEGMDWIDVAQDMDTWRTFVNAVMNLRVP